MTCLPGEGQAMPARPVGWVGEGTHLSPRVPWPWPGLGLAEGPEAHRPPDVRHHSPRARSHEMQTSGSVDKVMLAAAPPVCSFAHCPQLLSQKPSSPSRKAPAPAPLLGSVAGMTGPRGQAGI